MTTLWLVLFLVAVCLNSLAGLWLLLAVTGGILVRRSDLSELHRRLDALEDNLPGANEGPR